MMNLSQGDLAKAAGVSVSTVHKFETGTITNMNVTNLMALLRPVGLLDRLDDLDGHDHEYEYHQPDGPAPAGWPTGQVRRPDSGAAGESISDGSGASETKGKEEEQWLGI